MKKYPTYTVDKDIQIRYNRLESAVYGVRFSRNPRNLFGSGYLATIGKVCYTESPKRRGVAPTC